ncbi:delta-like protein C [Strongylocentrotus purpuratus]|uniref:EGF-like domain-containing protein n=1 Tax=Strongylocentrotus purpuratus TaxID=7668 RepID=A0A7M7P3F8_STRPU|nr:delta-like protein C [Strongylocentrotus purpuratus]
MGYAGKDCETNIDDCNPDPCENRGTCTDRVNDYTCACEMGYAGKDCETNIDDCNPDPCENGGTCTDGVNDYTCACVMGYAGKDCETSKTLSQNKLQTFIHTLFM